MRTLLIAALVCLVSGPAFAQSGLISMSAAQTNNAYTITLPPPQGGQTRVQVAITASYDQTVTIWDVLGAPISGYAVWGNETRCDSGALNLCTTELRRARTPTIIDCVDPAGCAATIRSDYSTGFTATLNTLTPERTFVLSNTSRSAVYTSWAFGGQPGHWTSSYVANTVNWAYLP